MQTLKLKPRRAWRWCQFARTFTFFVLALVCGRATLNLAHMRDNRNWFGRKQWPSRRFRGVDKQGNSQIAFSGFCIIPLPRVSSSLMSRWPSVVGFCKKKSPAHAHHHATHVNAVAECTLRPVMAGALPMGVNTPKPRNLQIISHSMARLNEPAGGMTGCVVDALASMLMILFVSLLT